MSIAASAIVSAVEFPSRFFPPFTFLSVPLPPFSYFDFTQSNFYIVVALFSLIFCFDAASVESTLIERCRIARVKPPAKIRSTRDQDVRVWGISMAKKRRSA